MQPPTTSPAIDRESLRQIGEFFRVAGKADAPPQVRKNIRLLDDVQLGELCYWIMEIHIGISRILERLPKTVQNQLELELESHGDPIQN